MTKEQKINQEMPWKTIVVVGPGDNKMIKKLGERSRKNQQGRLDYGFSGPGGGINHRRMFALRQRMGIS